MDTHCSDYNLRRWMYRMPNLGIQSRKAPKAAELISIFGVNLRICLLLGGNGVRQEFIKASHEPAYAAKPFAQLRNSIRRGQYSKADTDGCRRNKVRGRSAGAFSATPHNIFNHEEIARIHRVWLCVNLSSRSSGRGKVSNKT
jgi:hypothetical protein